MKKTVDKNDIFVKKLSMTNEAKKYKSPENSCIIFNG